MGWYGTLWTASSTKTLAVFGHENENWPVCKTHSILIRWHNENTTTKYVPYRNETTKATTRKKFFAEIEAELPMEIWLTTIGPYCNAKSTNSGRPRKDLEVLLRAYIAN